MARCLLIKIYKKYYPSQPSSPRRPSWNSPKRPSFLYWYILLHGLSGNFKVAIHLYCSRISLVYPKGRLFPGKKCRESLPGDIGK